MVAPDKPEGMGDNPQAGFETSLADYQGLYRLVLTAYGYRCALTGERFLPEGGLIHPHLEAVAIRPRDSGGPLAITNYLAVEEHAGRAFRAGHIVIADDYRILLPEPHRLQPALARRLGEKLFLPEETMFWPDREHLGFHRRLRQRG